MIPVLYPSTQRTFTNNGLGGLPHAVSCFTTEKRNTVGGYYLEMEYPVDGLHYSDLAPERIIYAASAPNKKPQPFYIERISRPINGVVTIEAPHVSAQLQKIATHGKHTAHTFTGITYDFAQTARALGQEFPFWFSTDMVFTEKVFDFSKPVGFMSILQGAEGSVLDVYGGEYEFDHYQVILHEQRGTDSGLEVRYGVNMTELDAETDASDLVTAVLPYWKGKANDAETVIVGDLCLSQNASAFAFARTLPVDVSNQFDLAAGESPTKAQVTAAGQSYISSKAATSLTTSIKTAFTPAAIGDRPLYLCDTVKVVHPDLDLSSTAKVVETRYNVLADRYESVTIGGIRKNIVDTIADMIRKGG